MASKFPDIPPDMRKVYRRLQQWRSAHAGRVPIPELWMANHRIKPRSAFGTTLDSDFANDRNRHRAAKRAH